MFEKGSLLRLVKSPLGEVTFDESHKKPGRGAYVCKSADCFARARKGRGFERAFRGQVAEEIMLSLEATLLECADA